MLKLEHAKWIRTEFMLEHVTAYTSALRSIRPNTEQP